MLNVDSVVLDVVVVVISSVPLDFLGNRPKRSSIDNMIDSDLLLLKKEFT